MSCIRGLNRAVALLLLFIFSILFAVPLIHSHSGFQNESIEVAQDYQVSCNTPASEFLVDCDVCEFLLCQQNFQLPMLEQLQLVPFKTGATKSVAVYKASVSKLSYYSWTNKGPPHA